MTKRLDRWLLAIGSAYGFVEYTILPPPHLWGLVAHHSLLSYALAALMVFCTFYWLRKQKGE